MAVFNGDDREIDFEEEDTLTKRFEDKDLDAYDPAEEERWRKIDAELDN